MSHSHHWSACHVAPLKQEYTKILCMVFDPTTSPTYTSASPTQHQMQMPHQNKKYSGGESPRKRPPCSQTLMRNLSPLL